MQITSNTRKITLDHRAIAYVRDFLEGGNTLSELILKHISLEQGSVTTVLPQNVTMEEAHKFELGGKTPEPPEHLWKRFKGGGVAIPIVSLDFFVSDTIYNHLSIDPSMICIIGSLLDSATYPYIIRSKDRNLTYKDEVYTLYMRDNFNKEDPPEGHYANNIVVLSSISEKIDFSNKKKTILTIYELLYIAKHTVKIAINAYDYESYLVWERDK